VPKKPARNFVSNRSALLSANGSLRKQLMLCLSANAAARTSIVVLYYATLNLRPEGTLEALIGYLIASSVGKWTKDQREGPGCA